MTSINKEKCMRIAEDIIRRKYNKKKENIKHDIIEHESVIWNIVNYYADIEDEEINEKLNEAICIDTKKILEICHEGIIEKCKQEIETKIGGGF